MEQHWIVIGAGPAGIGAAICLAKRGFSVDVYESLSSLEQSDEDSYPIGLNPRGMNALDHMDGSGALRDSVASETPIDAWNIYDGTKVITSFPSGTTVGATRGGVTFCLYQEACEKYSNKITFHFERKLISINFLTKSLEFQLPDSTSIHIDGQISKIVSCDGVWSKVRREYERTSPDTFEVKKVPWGCSFRLLFSTDHPETTLNPKEHHIFASGVYAAVVRADSGKWVIAIQISSANEYEGILESSDDSEENINLLKEYVATAVPLAMDMIPEEEYKKFFSRRTFSGAVISTSSLHIEEWVVFLGDSAHSVFPAIGEGINCALEDVQKFDECMGLAEGGKLFQYYNEMRMEDINAVTTYAEYLVHSSNAKARCDKIARISSMIILQIGKKLGLVGPIWNDKSFGTKATEVEPYRNLLQVWQRQQRIVGPISQCIGYSIDLVLRMASVVIPSRFFA